MCPVTSNSSRKPFLQAWDLTNTSLIKRDCRRRAKIDRDQRCLVVLTCTGFIGDKLRSKKVGECVVVKTIQELQRT